METPKNIKEIPRVLVVKTVLRITQYRSLVLSLLPSSASQILNLPTLR